MRTEVSIPERNVALENQIIHEIKCSDVLACLLVNRGIKSPTEAQKFLRPLMKDLECPTKFKHMSAAVSRLRRAITKKEKIAVFGDYDVDGITAATIIFSVLNHLSTKVKVFIPQRSDGYGINIDAVKQMHNWGADLIITVDNGITGNRAIKYGQEKGVDFIITDHHEEGRDTPQGVPILNPKAQGESYPFRDLAGAGVAFKLALALARDVKITPDLREILTHCVALAGLGTIADVVPLIGENRILAAHGIRLLGESKHPGINALRDVSGSKAKITSGDIAFYWSPRLNAAGRIGDSNQAFNLLMAKNAQDAIDIAKLLNKLNTKRQDIEKTMLAQLTKEIGDNGQSCIVIAQKGWSRGVLGIAASRIAKKYLRPTILITIENGKGYGSGRTAGEIDLLQMVKGNDHFLLQYGGHAAACGLRIQEDKISAFRKNINQTVSKQRLRNLFHADAELDPCKLNHTIIDELDRLAPFGEGNRQPRFITDLEIIDSRAVGRDGSHLSISARSKNRAYRCIFFGGAAHGIPDHATVAYTPVVNTFGGRNSIELQILHVF